MLVWRDTGEEQLGAGGILAVRTGPMGVPLVDPSPGISAGGCYGTPPTPRLANLPRSRKDAPKRFHLRNKTYRWKRATKRRCQGVSTARGL